METSVRRVLALTMVLSPLAIAGCAWQSDVDELRSELSKTQATADAAAADARAARQEAAAANARADSANKAATDVSRKADRMYDRSLRK